MEQLDQCLACNSTNHQSYVQTSAMMHNDNSTNYNFDKCDDCGLVFLNPRVEESALSQYYTSAYLPYRIEDAWGKYASFVQQDQRNIDRKRVKTIKANHHLNKASRILDIGCGKPTFLAALRDDTPAQLIGIDFSDKGWVNEMELYKNIQLRKGVVADLKNEPPVDVITMWHYLEHDYRPQEHLRHLLKIAHPNTQLIIEVPNFNSSTRRRFGKHWSGYHTPRHTALYSPKNIKTLLDNSGWQVEKSYAFGTLDPYTLHWMSKMEQQKIDWSSSMEPRFWGYVAGMVLHMPYYLFQRLFSMGFMTVIGKPK